MAGYRIGDYDRRPWGSWLVIDVGEIEDGSCARCDKIIVVDPNRILSLQSHALRHETWTVLDGTLTVLIDGQCETLGTGRTVDVPVQALHCMANLGKAPCVIKERQTGTCKEDDITRYLDAYGRAVAAMDENAQISARLYNSLLDETRKRVMEYA